MRSVTSPIVAIALAASSTAAAAQGDHDGPSADTELVGLFDTICGQNAEPGAEFGSVSSDEMPLEMGLFYLGPTEGLYWRRSGRRPAWVALTRGRGHWAGIEADCTIAVQGAHFDAVASTFAKRYGAGWAYGRDGKLMTWKRGSLVNVTLHDGRTKETALVTQRPDGWISVSAPVDPATHR